MPIRLYRRRLPLLYLSGRITQAGLVDTIQVPSRPEYQYQRPSSTMAPDPTLPSNQQVHFGPFAVTREVFHLTPTTFAIVNIRPLLPGHILVCPLRPHKHLTDLGPLETADLFITVQRIQRTLARLYGVEAFNVALQDGVAAGQSVEHVHVHVLPRKEGDGAGEDRIYGMLEGREGDVGAWLEVRERLRVGDKFRAVDEAARGNRSAEEMHEEAMWLKAEMAKDAAGG